MAPAALLSVKPGEKVLDLCAAPGGKSTQLGDAMKGEGLLVCNEIHPQRARILSENIERMGIRNALVLNHDPAVLSEHFPLYFDKVLVDAPCSGLGIIRKKPDVRYKKADDLFTLPVIQTALLDNAARYVAPGGVLVYSTCTILPEENEQVTDAFLTEHSDFCRDGFTLPAPVGETEGQLTLWPQRHGTDGFYICRMKRT